MAKCDKNQVTGTGTQTKSFDLNISPQRKEYFLLQMHLSSLPGLQKSDAEIVDEFKLIFEVRKHVWHGQ